MDHDFIDRRKKTLTNRIRRFVNNYWLIPVFTLYLELFAIILPPINSPVENFKERNLYFLRGPVIFYNLVSTDFPNTLIGHFKEIVLVKKYTFNVDQVPFDDMVMALEDKESVTHIYRRVIESRAYNNTEIGGIATLVYGSDGPELRLYEITSVNKVFSDRLHGLENSPIDEFISLIQEQESKDIITKVGIDEYMINNLINLLLSEKLDRSRKKALMRNFIKTYDLHSEAKYILSPYDLKSFLGSTDIEGKYVGLFHFHNNYMEPPSDVDIANSRADRQIVITLGDRGIVIYDIVKGKSFIYRGDLIS